MVVGMKTAWMARVPVEERPRVGLMMSSSARPGMTMRMSQRQERARSIGSGSRDFELASRESSTSRYEESHY